MHKNSYWLAFLVVVGLCTLYFCIRAYSAVHNYVGLSERAIARDVEWEVEEGRRGQLIPLGRYQIVVQGEKYEGESLLSSKKFLGRSAVDTVLDGLKEKRHLVWYNPRDPRRSALQKSFPFKECLSAVTLLGVFFYLVYIGYKVGSAQRY